LRKLIVAILIAAGFWSGYWYIGKTAKFEVLTAWLESRRAVGWTAEYSDFRVVGYPNRFDSRFTDLNLRSPKTGIGWKTPIFNILALSYKPNHIIAAFANTQTLSFPLEDVTVDSSKMMASVVFEPDTKLAVDRIRLLAEDLALTGSKGWRAKADSLAFSTRLNPSVEFGHDALFDATNVTPTEAFRVGLDPKGRLPATIDTLVLDVTLGFTAPWDRIAVEEGIPLVTSIKVNRTTMSWGELGLSADGSLSVAPDGLVTGNLNLSILNWREVLDLTVTSGLLDQSMADTIRRGLELLTLGASDPTRLSVPLTLADGRMSLGPIPLGFAPRFIR
jgi:hypothetical protein